MVVSQLQAVAQRFDHEYRGESFELPDEVEEMAVFRDWVAGSLTPRITSKFWDVVRPKKGQRCLDIGCGLSFLIYPWKEWKAFFVGQEISKVAQAALNQRGPQLDSKLFKGVQLAPAHKLDYEPATFDLAIATGVSCYYPLDYWEQVMAAVKPCLKPGGSFVFDVVNPEQELAENWAILETYLGADVELVDLKEWRALIKRMGAKVTKQVEGEVFHTYRVQWVS
ncbi:MAG: class I SAM-dependent methyltransferase [Leptolyngbyaceae cyanobacterium MAG.088]|nr:class I SAM-dependent methyltransferase [Leptolyngbyaceae cyanobacterium MAG.088]